MANNTEQNLLLETVAREAKVNQKTVQTVIELLEEGNTVPFIARYRKEATGGMDEVQIKTIQDQWQYALHLMERKKEVLRLIEEQGKLTDELEQQINEATKLQRVEDLYRPFRQKRRTRAVIAKEKGLEPLAEKIWKQQSFALDEEAAKYFPRNMICTRKKMCYPGLMILLRSGFPMNRLIVSIYVKKRSREERYDRP